MSVFCTYTLSADVATDQYSNVSKVLLQIIPDVLCKKYRSTVL